MPRQTTVSTKSLLNLKIATLAVVVVLSGLLVIYFLNSLVFIPQKSVSTDFFSQPLVNFSLSEGSGLTVSSIGSIKNMTATMDGSMVFWKETSRPSPNFPKTLDGLVGYWKFDNSLADSSDNSNTAITQGGIDCTDNFGRIGFGCTFGEANKYLDISSVRSSIDPKNGSISAWAYPTENRSNTYVIEGMGPSTDRYYIQWSNGSLRVVRGNPGAVITLLNNVELNQWYHLTLTWDETNIYGYLNGELKGQIAYTSTHGAPSRFYIGNQKHNTENRTFPGSIDEVAFFNKKLTDSEVLAIYNDISTYNPESNSQKNLFFDNTSTSNYGRLRINNHAELQKLNITDSFTIEAEVFLTSYPENINYPYTIYTDYITHSSANALVVLPGGRVRVYANTGNTRYIFTAEQSQVPLNQWVKIAGSFNVQTEEMSILVNDTEHGTSAPQKTSGIAKNFGRPIIGMAGNWQYGLKGGYIRNLKVWNHSFLIGQYLSDCSVHKLTDAQGLVAYYNFNGTVDDSTSNKYKGYFFGKDGVTNPFQSLTNPTFVQGPDQQAIVFDGKKDYVALNMQYCGNVHLINELTVCARFKTDVKTGSIFSNWAFVDFDRSEYYNLFITPDGRIGFSTNSAQDNNSINDFYSSKKGLNDNEWHFVCGVFNKASGQKSIYIDGRNDVTATNIHNRKPLGSSLTRFGFIGDGSEAASLGGLMEYSNSGFSGRNEQYFKGVIDEVRIYHKALSFSEIDNIRRRSERTYNITNTIKYCSDLISQKGRDKCINYIALSIPREEKSYNLVYDQRVDEICSVVPDCYNTLSQNTQTDFKIASASSKTKPVDQLKNGKIISGELLETVPFWGSLTCNAKRDNWGSTKPGELTGSRLVVCPPDGSNCAERIYGNKADDNPYIGTLVRNLMTNFEQCPDLGQDAACRSNEYCLCQVISAAGGMSQAVTEDKAQGNKSEEYSGVSLPCIKCFNPVIEPLNDGSGMSSMGSSGIPGRNDPRGNPYTTISGTQSFLESVREIFDCIDDDNRDGCNILPSNCSIGRSYDANDTGNNHKPGIALDIICCTDKSNNSNSCNVDNVETLISRIEKCRGETNMNIIRECTNTERTANVTSSDLPSHCAIVHIDTRDRPNITEPCTSRNGVWDNCP